MYPGDAFEDILADAPGIGQSLFAGLARWIDKYMVCTVLPGKLCPVGLLFQDHYLGGAVPDTTRLSDPSMDYAMQSHGLTLLPQLRGVSLCSRLPGSSLSDEP